MELAKDSGTRRKSNRNLVQFNTFRIFAMSHMLAVDTLEHRASSTIAIFMKATAEKFDLKSKMLRFYDRSKPTQNQ